MGANHQPPPLRCACGEALRLAEEATCAGCGFRATVDDVGIARLAAADHPWTGVSSGVAEHVLAAGDVDDLVRTLHHPRTGWDPTLQRRLLAPATGIAATLAPVGEGSPVLALGTGWGALGSVASFLGATVVNADWVYARLRLGQLGYDTPADLAVHLDIDAPLPWADGSFDAAFVDMSELRGAVAATGCHAEDVLTEVRRLLAPEGVLVAGVANRIKAGLTRTGRAARRPGSARRRRSVRPWWDDGLGAAGFVELGFYGVYPRLDGWRWLAPPGRLRRQMLEAVPAGSVKERAKRAVAAAGLAAWVAPAYYVVAQDATSSGVPPRPLAEMLVSGPAVARSRTGAWFVVEGDRQFVKFPLSSRVQRSFRVEVEKTGQARKTGFGRFVVPTATVRRHRGITYGEYPRIASRAVTLDESEHVVDGVLGAIDTGQVGTMDSTDLWRRLEAARSSPNIADLGAEVVYRTVLEECPGAVVPVAPGHADLGPDNVLLSTAGRPYLVDWGRLEERHPAFLDPVQGALAWHQRRRDITLGAAYADFVDDAIPGPLAARARRLLGELSPLEAAMVRFLHETTLFTRPRRRHSPWVVERHLEVSRILTARLRGT